ncbi:unnamed protein product [Gordionus sp. m RMFG-2023]
MGGASLHHVQICCKDGLKVTSKLMKQLKLKLWATKITKTCYQWVLKSHQLIFIVIQRQSSNESPSDFLVKQKRKGMTNNDYDIDQFVLNENPLDDKCVEEWDDFTVFCCNNPSYHLNGGADSVFNIALRVDNLIEILGRCCHFEVNSTQNNFLNINIPQEISSYIDGSNDVRSDSLMSRKEEDLYDGQSLNSQFNNMACIIQPVTEISDEFGCIKYAIIRSCVGNVLHTLIDDSEYRGPFLPNYMMRHLPNKKTIPAKNYELESSENLNENQTENMKFQQVSINLFTKIDHVAIACHTGQYSSIISWYSYCLDFHRFKLNSKESNEEGFVIKNDQDLGVRLLAMEYWKCREHSILSSALGKVNRFSKKSLPFHLVLAESLMPNVSDQISSFISAHGGPGIQHIALSCPDIFTTRNILTESGLEFLVTPETYYKDDVIVKRIKDIEIDWAKIYGTGILIDTDDNPVDINNNEIIDSDKRYLLQIFSKPIFQEGTFFLELIERHKTDGFGAGNIPALWRAVKRHMENNDKILTF